MTNGEFIRQRLIEAGDRGVVIADLHRERKANHIELGVIYKGGTYQSFSRLFYFLEQLKWVEPTGVKEPGITKGDAHRLLSSRTYYRITSEGLAHLEVDWTDPIAVLHPEWAGSSRSLKYRVPTGMPRGRPRVAPPKVRVEKPPSPPAKRVPKKVVPTVELTEGDKNRVVSEFRELFSREPTRLEIYDLFKEELKMKQKRLAEEE